MTAMEWWANVLQGSVGAIIGLIGLFTVFWGTKKHELKRDRVAREAQEKKAAEERTLSSVAAVMQSSLTLRAKTLDDSEQGSRFADELMMFCVREIRDHPNVAQWAQEQSSEVVKCMEPHQDIRALPWQAGMISAALTKWVYAGFPEDMLKPKLPEERAKEHDAHQAKAESVTITRNDLKNLMPEVFEKFPGVAGLKKDDLGT